MGRYNTFWPRFWAGFLDSLIFVPLGLIDGWMLDPERPAAVLLSWAALSYSSSWLYSVILHARYGQTLGKMATGVRVLDVSERGIPSFRQAFLRDIGSIVMSGLAFLYFVRQVLTRTYSEQPGAMTTPAMILSVAVLSWFFLEVVTMLSNDKRRAVHDFIAGTVVVKDS